jgi:hypothetical protein
MQNAFIDLKLTDNKFFDYPWRLRDKAKKLTAES